MQVLVCLHVVQFRVIQFVLLGLVIRVCIYNNLIYLSTKFKEKLHLAFESIQ